MCKKFQNLHDSQNSLHWGLLLHVEKIVVCCRWMDNFRRKFTSKYSACIEFAWWCKIARVITRSPIRMVRMVRCAHSLLTHTTVSLARYQTRDNVINEFLHTELLTLQYIKACCSYNELVICFRSA